VPPRATIYWITGGVMLLECIKAATLSGGSITLPVIALLTAWLIHIMQPRTQRKIFS
jgi:hypothetical protein